MRRREQRPRAVPCLEYTAASLRSSHTENSQPGMLCIYNHEPMFSNRYIFTYRLKKFFGLISNTF